MNKKEELHINELLTPRVIEGIWNIAEKKDVKEWNTEDRKEEVCKVELDKEGNIVKVYLKLRQVVTETLYVEIETSEINRIERGY